MRTKQGKSRTRFSCQVSQISIRELEVFLEVVRTKSIRETARRSHVEPGQVSRLIKRLEEKIGVRLMERNASGISLTQHGTAAVQSAEAILRESSELSVMSRGSEYAKQKILGFASASFLCARMLAPIVGKLADNDEAPHLRLIDVAPDQMISLGLKGAFDLALHVGQLDWPRSWHQEEVGQISWHLYASQRSAVPTKYSVSTIKKCSFIYPIYWTNEGLIEGSDQCPLPLSQRNLGIATSTAETALAVLKHSNQLAFLPDILAKSSVDSREIFQISVREWKPVVKKLFLTVRTDVVPNKFFKNLCADIRNST